MMNFSPLWRQDELAGYKLRELYHSHGYTPYRMGKFEEYDLYVRNKSFLVSENILTFTDTDGRLMALKPDVTLSIVKNTVDNAAALQKVYYHENVYRTPPGATGYREIPQTGLECIGALDTYAVGEVLALAEESLSLLGSDYLLDVSHMGIAAGMLEGISETVQKAILLEIGRKNLPAIRGLCRQYGLSSDLTERLGRLAMLYGQPREVLPQLAELAAGTAEEALAELSALCELLETMCRASHLRLDFSVVGGMHYYNGLIFRGYLHGLAGSVLAGGRYDNLLHRMGKHGGAIGFAVYLDQLERLAANVPAYDADTLLLYGENDAPADVAARAADLLAQGRSVRAERCAPPGLRFRTVETLGKGDAQ